MVRLITYKNSFKFSGDHCLLHTVSVSPRFFDLDPSSSVYCFVIISSNWGGRFENVWNPLSSHRGKWSTVPSFTRGIPEWGADDGESGIPDSGFCGWLIAVLLALLYRRIKSNLSHQKVIRCRMVDLIAEALRKLVLDGSDQYLCASAVCPLSSSPCWTNIVGILGISSLKAKAAADIKGMKPINKCNTHALCPGKRYWNI